MYLNLVPFGNDPLFGGADTLTGDQGADLFAFQFGESTVLASDRITDLEFSPLECREKGYVFRGLFQIR
ncbi:hypothetical protein [Nostoc sp. NMS9]|uniref:hypothetical protein n=1 Tax=Nostoc sp. NMS9 TaxID=2815393 RepID=UPI0025CCEAD1|nr:hypothetical protein [Nostoc sp. NMS9]MBN3941689.1 hypothetical protein [Nostoc sp. NMS9]